MVDDPEREQKDNAPDRLERLILLLSQLRSRAQKAYSHRSEQAAKGWSHFFRVLGCDLIWLLSAPIRLLLWAFSDYGHAMAVFTLIYVIFAGAQWCTMRGQLSEMKSSSMQTGETIAALQRQANTLVESARAKVYLKDMHPSSKNVKGDAAVWTFVPDWANGGQLGTRHLTVSTNCSLVKSLWDDPFEQADWDQSTTRASYIGPGQTAHGQECMLPFDPLATPAPYVTLVDRINSGALHFYISGIVRYQDGIQPKIWHITEFSTELVNLSPQKTFFMQADPQMKGKHNCTDEDCPDYKTQTQDAPHDTPSVP